MDIDASQTQETLSSPDIASIQRKAHFTGKVIKTTLAGAIVDIGLGVPGVVHISQLQEQPTNRVEDVVKAGQDVEVWVRQVFPKKSRIELTMIKPLDREWREIDKDMVMKGTVTRLEKFGVFVEIGAERPGLVHISEMTHDYVKSPGDIVKEGDEVEVKVLEVNRRKKQIKLSMKALEDKPVKVAKEALRTHDRPPRDKDKEKPAEESEKEEPVPTAMEMALRSAMERSRAHDDDDDGGSARSGKRGRRVPTDDEREDIFARTLQNKVRSSK
jgi:predicted RNA-binding protein with RPS1 domain